MMSCEDADTVESAVLGVVLGLFLFDLCSLSVDAGALMALRAGPVSVSAAKETVFDVLFDVRSKLT